METFRYQVLHSIIPRALVHKVMQDFHHEQKQQPQLPRRQNAPEFYWWRDLVVPCWQSFTVGPH